MKLVFCFVLVSVILAAVCAAAEEPNWEKYKESFNKKYDDPEEDARRKELYLLAVKEINEHNEKFDKGEVSWSKGVNQFADWTEDEKKKLHGAKPPTDDD